MKPDGWHTYHVCGGLLRELTWSGHHALCVVCGDWFEGAVVQRPSHDSASEYGRLLAERDRLIGLGADPADFETLEPPA